MLQSLPRNATKEQIAAALADLSEAEADYLLHDWSLWARPEQLPPPGEWTVWMFLGGRGSGKTRSGAEWVRSAIRHGVSRIALVAPTAADARDVMVEGNSGILSVCHKSDRDWRGIYVGRPLYEPSKRRLTWANGAIATTFSADEPDRLRGPQHEAAWCDEVVAWRYQREAWDMLMFGLRLGEHPQVYVSTTPKPQPLIKELRQAVNVVITTGSTYRNRANLAKSFFDSIVARYEGTTLGRQEIYAEIIDDVPGALWTRRMIEARRVSHARVAMERIVVAVDPAISNEENADEHGIVVAGRGRDQRGYVLDDRSCKGSPMEWGRRVVKAFDDHEADRIVYEANQGGDMVAHVLRTCAAEMYRAGERRSKEIPLKAVHASRGKVTRAEPVSALYEQGRVSHVGMFAVLEDQMCAFTSDFDRKRMGYSPDRVDALVWALTELMVNTRDAPFVHLGGDDRANPFAGL